MSEAIAVTSGVRYFSTVLHGAEVDHDEFATETEAIAEHVEEQRSAAPSDD
jgi:hypothetical protein